MPLFSGTQLQLLPETRKGFVVITGEHSIDPVSDLVLGIISKVDSLAYRCVRHARTNGVMQCGSQQLIFLHYGKPFQREFLHSLDESIGWSEWSSDDYRQGFEIFIRETIFLQLQNHIIGHYITDKLRGICCSKPSLSIKKHSYFVRRLQNSRLKI